MRAGNRQLFFLHQLEHLATRRNGRRWIRIPFGAEIRPRKLPDCRMEQISNKEELVIQEESRVPWGMTDCQPCNDAREDLLLVLEEFNFRW